MRTRTILAIPAAAVGLFAQSQVVISDGPHGGAGDGPVTIAQGVIGGMMGPGGGPSNSVVRFFTQEFSFNARTMTNAPYSADEKTESVQTLADGTHITNTTTERVYRDSQGRTRREMTLPGFGGEKQHTMITIMDPVAGVNYTLDPQSKTAHQMPGPPMPKAIAEAKFTQEMEAGGVMLRGGFARQAPPPTMKHEDLGADLIEGVSVKGTRDTETIEAGAMGNDRPITITSERWFAPDLQIELKSVHNDPRMGQTTHTVTSISRTEPDASLFQVPADYNKMDDPKGMHVERFDVHQ